MALFGNGNTSGTIADLYRNAARHSFKQRREYELNHAFLEGDQWLQWDTIARELENLGADIDAERVRATINHLGANYRTIISQLTQRGLSYQIHPSGYDDATLRGARLGEAHLLHVRDREDLEDLREIFARDVFEGGAAIISIDWVEAEQRSHYSVLPITNYVVEPGAIRAEKARWWIKLQTMSPAEVQSIYSEFYGDKTPKPDGQAGGTIRYTDDSEATIPMVYVYTYYERPNPLNPKGGFKVEVNGEIVERGEWMFPWKDRLNFRQGTERPSSSGPYGTTIFSDAREAQSMLNAAWSTIIEHLREMSTHRIVMDQTWQDAIDTLTDDPKYPLVGDMSQGRTPQYLKAPPLPTTALDSIAMLKAEIDNMFGVHDVSRGQAPANIESGYGLSILAEKDSSPAGRMIKQIAKVFSGLAKMELALAEKYLRKEQTASIRLADGIHRQRTWTGKQINGQHDAEVPLDAIIPRSRAAMQEQANRALEMGLIDPADPLGFAKYIKMADMPDQRGMLAAMNPDVAKAIRENEMFMFDEVPLPATFDDHEIHLKVINDFRKTPEYENATEEQRRDVDNHALAHERYMADQMAQRAQEETLDPRLSQLPRADGAPPLPPLEGELPPMPGQEEPIPTQEEIIASGDATLDLLMQQVASEFP